MEQTKIAKKNPEIRFILHT